MQTRRCGGIRSHRIYTDEFKANALRVYNSVGLNEACRRVGVDKHTLLSWIDKAGIDRKAVNARISAQAAEAAAASASRRVREAEESREKLLLRLTKIRDAAALRELEILVGGNFDQSNLRDVSNSRAAAVRDAELLGGFPTSRTENLVDAEQLLRVVGLAFVAALELIPMQLRDSVSATFASALREARDWSANGRLELGPPGGEIVDEEQS